MATSNRRADITLLFDSYMTESQNLHNSFKASGVDCNAVVINDDGFLPDGVESVYQYFLKLGKSGKPKYFNEIPIPDYWEITSTNNSGTINDMGRVKARMFYANPTNKRLVRAVEWLDDKNIVRFCDYYNKQGVLYARSTFDASQKIILKSYFDKKGREVIVEDFVTGDIILNLQGKVIIFDSKVDFVLYYLRETGLDEGRLFINSLGTPFFVSNKLGAGDMSDKKDILFWQEYKRDDIPGNMQFIIEGKAPRINRIFVQKKSAYDKLIELGAPEDIVSLKGYVYPFVRNSRRTREALILTNSDKIDHLSDIVEALPDVHFHVAALTEMSSKLMSHDRYDNVTLYPTVTEDMVNKLYGKCDIYLDINREAEILSAVNRAFLNNQLIFAFKETLHNINVVPDAHRFPTTQYATLTKAINKVCLDDSLWDKLLDEQRAYALSESSDSYREL